MAIRMVTQIDGVDFEVTLSRDDAGNYVAEAALASRRGAPGEAPPSVRVVDAAKERALTSLFGSLQRLAAERRAGAPRGPDAPAAA